MAWLGSAVRRIRAAVGLVKVGWRSERTAARHGVGWQSESLEQRLFLMAVSWDGGGDGISWNNALNWSGDQVPQAADDVTISEVGGSTIRITSGAQAIHSLSSGRPIVLSGGSLSLATTAQIISSLTLSGGKLLGGTWTGGKMVLTASGGELNGVTLNSDIDATANGAHATVLGSLTLNGTATLGGATDSSGCRLDFNGTQSLLGSGSVILRGKDSAVSVSGDDVTFTIGPEMTIRGGTSNNGGIDAQDAAVVNQGRISADVSGTELTIEAFAGFTNQGVVEAREGGELNVFMVSDNVGAVALSGPSKMMLTGMDYACDVPLTVPPESELTFAGSRLTIDAAVFVSGGKLSVMCTDPVNRAPMTITTGGQLDFLGGFTNQSTLAATGAVLNLGLLAEWNNAGTIEATDSDVTLAGKMTWARIGNLVRHGGKLTFAGALDNREATLDADDYPGELILSGQIQGGTITGSAASTLMASNLTLDGVVVNADLQGKGAIQLVNTVTLNGTMTWERGSDSMLLFDDDAQLLGSGTLLCRSDSGSLFGTGALTIGPDVTIRTDGPGSISAWGQITNQGRIVADSPESHITFSYGSLINQGIVEAVNGGTLEFGISVSVGGSGVVRGTPSGKLIIKKDCLYSPANAAAGDLPGILEVAGGSLWDAPVQQLEVSSADKGAVPAGFLQNHAYRTIELESHASLKLVDRTDTAPGTANEAVYVDSLIVNQSATLNLNGLHLYARSARIDGQVTGGTVSLIHDGGPILLDHAAPGRIAAVAEVDEWTFAASSGQRVTITVDPGSGKPGSPIEPNLLWAHVQLLDASGRVVAQAMNSSSGQLATLDNVSLAAAGTYRIRVGAPANHPKATGNYTVAAWNAAPLAQPLVLNQQVVGRVQSAQAPEQWSFSASAGQQVRFWLSGRASSSTVFDLTGPNGWKGFTGLGADSDLLTLPAAGTYVLTARDPGDGGAYSFRLGSAQQIDLALGATYNGQLVGNGQTQLFRIQVPVGTPMCLELDDASASDRNELYVKLGSPPTRGSFDYRSNPAADQQLLVPMATPGDWYVLLYSDAVPATSSYTLRATAPRLTLSSATPDLYGDQEDAMMTLSGAGFDASTTVTLVASDGTTYPAGQVSVESFTQITAIYPVGSLPAGTYSVRLSQTDGDTAALADAVRISSTGQAKLETRLVLPSQLGRHALATIYVEYANTGTIAMRAPLLMLGSADPDGSDQPFLTLDVARASQGLWTSAVPDGFSTSILLMASGQTAGVLQPGESVRVPVYYVGLQQPWDFSDDQVELALRVLDSNTTEAVDWTTIASNRPAWIDTDAWAALVTNLQTQIGSTWGDCIRKLDDDAAYLQRLGQKVTDVSDLWGFEFQKANGLSLVDQLADAVDAVVATPGLGLFLQRAFSPSILGRSMVGLFGRGWSTNWDLRLASDADGSVTLVGPGGSRRRFQPDGRNPVVFFAQAGDRSKLTAVADGIYQLTDPDGTVTRFRSDGTIDYRQDPSGSRITAAYTNGRLTSLTHSAGPSLTLAYNAAGRVCSITDSAARTTSYTYDASGEHLLFVQDSDGRTTSYTYDTAGDPATQHALLAVRFSSGAHRFYDYDDQGRLTGAWRDGEAERISLAYDSTGQVTFTDAAGGSSRFFFDHRGLILKAVTPSGDPIQYFFDGQLRLTGVTNPQGMSETYKYDALGRLTAVTDLAGNKTQYTYSGILDHVASMTDARGNITRYTLDAAGNRTSIIYADGSADHATFDAAGNVLSYTNRRGQTTTYTYNAAGQTTRQSFADGSHIDYVYDPRGNLTSATDANGSISLEYDAADQLTRITYPNGRFLSYVYDAAGRRTRMTDQDGFIVNYAYDPAGRLSGLRDGADALVVAYTYDAAGRLARKDLGNGTYTTWQYDAAGRVIHLINYAPDGSINSRFDYGYDSVGQRSSMTTLDGAWTYSYDAAGRLTHAVFASTNDAIPDQDLSYSYDAAGNRIRATENGVVSDYLTNSLNQYTRVGDTPYAYDADGNLISDGVYTYSYDAGNRLIGVAGASDTWTYAYDPLGNRSACVHDGQRTEYLLDPSGMGNVVGEYDGSGTAIAHYTYGWGLNSRIDGAGSVAYYDFDALGSTAGLSGSAGSYLSSYSYLPFGQALSASGSVANPFQFVGQLGVGTEASGLQFMRARFYDPSIGRFNSEDPLGVGGGDINLYNYARSNPILFVDPNGRESFTITRCPPTNIPTTPGPHTVTVSFEDGTPPITVTYNGEDLPTKCEDVIVEIVEDPPRPEMDAWTVFKDIIWDPYWLRPQHTDPGDNDSSDVAQAVDPNELTGPAGFGAANYLSPDGAFPYRIDFENDAKATAPAQQVIITNQLPASLDWSTLELADIGFGDTVINVPARSQHFQTTVPMTYNGQAFNVEIEVGLNSNTGQLRAVFQSIDPATSLPPDVMIGFLPPEDGTGRGMGYITYLVKPKANLPSGTAIRNVAQITFDRSETIATNQVDPHDPAKGTDPAKEALVTIDAGLPSSAVMALPAQAVPGRFTVSWSGQDEAGGSGIASYDIYVSDNGGPYTLWLDNTAAPSASFDGVVGHTYTFYSIATDHVGHTEGAPLAPDATTTMDPSPFIQFKSASYCVKEKQKLATITVTRVGDLDKAVSISYSSGKGTAKAKAEYTPVAGTLSFAPGQTTATFVVSVVDDAAAEVDKTISLLLSNPTDGALLGIQRTAVLTIVDNDDRIAPAVKLGKLAAARAGKGSYAFAVTYTDNILVNRSTVGTGDILVYGPNGYKQVATLVSGTPTGNAASITATYQITAPGGKWDSADGGVYTFWLQAKQLRDTQKNCAAKQLLGSLTVAFAARSKTAAAMVNSLEGGQLSILLNASSAGGSRRPLVFNAATPIGLFAKGRRLLEFAEGGWTEVGAG